MRNTRLVAYVAAVTLAGAAFVIAGPVGPAAAATCKGTAPSDFNGDGISDAVATEIGQNNDRGDFHVLYGTRSGLSASSPQDSLFQGADNDDGGFGEAVAAGDFNGDGCTDLAVADPDTTVNGKDLAGIVSIYAGTPAGLENIDTDLVPGDAGGASVLLGHFGQALAAGDVTGDGVADLVVGAIGEDAIYVFPGGIDGLTAGARYAEGAGGVPGSIGNNEFGNALATGDFNGDGRDDVAIGSPGENNSAGALVVLRGAANKSAPLTTTGAQLWSQDSSGVPGSSEAGDSFGTAVATGDFKGNGRTDLAIGVPSEDVGSLADAGTTDILYSAGSSGLSSTGAQAWTQDSSGVPGTPETHDQFGAALASGDFNGNGKDDLAIGVYGESVGVLTEAGAINVLPGASGGLTGSGSSLWNQDTSGISGTSEQGDRFGYSLSALRVKSSSRDDLLVGVPDEALGSTAGAGMMHFLPGSSHGLTATGSQAWDDDSTGVQGVSCSFCDFGFGLA